MSIHGLVSIKKGLSTLNPKQVREMSARQVRIALHAASQEGYQRLESFFLHDLSPARRRQSALLLTRAPISPLGQQCDFAVYDEPLAAPAGALVFSPDRPHHLVEQVLHAYPDLGVPLAKSFLPFRRPFIHRVISKTSRENTLFSITTALPDVIPNVLELPWAVAEFASDTAFLTMNQVRMAFLIAAASDREVGYSEQKSEIATVIGSAFGWRALARQLVGKIPFGGGLLAKAAVAYAGTKVLGLSLDHYYSIGFTYTRQERDRIYADAFRQGKKVAARILSFLRPDLAARYATDASKQNIVVPAVPSYRIR
ncbi:MAG: hypothetical protein JO091_05935 [Acidobacteriaceae bacterium]|nr:hypothetical protein [Acidobacteriaceae bacterium]